jgi:hypothetical protein
MKHLIRKQVIELQLDAGQNAFLMQQQAREYYYQHVTPVMEKLFDELSTENEIISIGKLEIELGELGWKNGRFALDEHTLYGKLKESFKKAISSPAETNNATDNIKYHTPEENACLQWLFYMESGQLPWEMRNIDSNWHQKVIHQLAIDHRLVLKTKKLILGSYWFLLRVVKEHDEIFLQQLTEVISAKKQTGLVEKIHSAAKLFETAATQPHVAKNNIWQTVLTVFARGESDIDVDKILPSSKDEIFLPVQRLADENMREGLFCQFAGLVLLHPFFKHLFGRLQLLHDGLFMNRNSLEKAIVLLYFVATGKTNAKDYELVIPKLLCGLPLHEVVNEESFTLTTDEKEEALNMMAAAIAQWTILHNTSADGLREGFLTREAKVVIQDTGITFTVEASAIDVLLDHLPWNLSLIKLPWLNELIRVEWR